MPEADSTDEYETYEPSEVSTEPDADPIIQCKRCQKSNNSSEELAQALMQIRNLREEKENLTRQNQLLSESLSVTNNEQILVDKAFKRGPQRNRDLLLENQRLKASLSFAQEANERLRNAADNFQLAMDNKEFLGPQATDDQLSYMYKTLLQRVKAWTQNISKSRNFNFDHITPDMLSKLRRVAPRCVEVSDYQEFLDTERRVRMFARGWIWLVMYNTLFPATHSVDNLEPVYDQWLDKGISRAVYLLEKRLYFAGEKVCPKHLIR